ncbi:uncharacterized protein G2W53_035193 [Senna tora]|uniref:Uncharacterized protein n=1 Tax=Senna tora TaxID=362788 RepID=A0A834SPU5_9FABA|nr:uncharacterized protein G2W53_035193 [Senna tora]
MGRPTKWPIRQVESNLGRIL